MDRPLLVTVAALVLSFAAAQLASAQGTAGALVQMLKSGRLPPERIESVVKLVTSRGGPDELAYVYEQVIAPSGFPPEVRKTALEGLIEAAANRGVVPSGDLSGLATLLENAQDRESRQAAARLAGLWKLEALVDELEQLAVSDQVDQALRESALQALVRMRTPAAQQAVEKLAAAKDQALRARGIAALADLDLGKAAGLAADYLSQASPEANITPVIRAFLGRQQGPERLAAALAEKDLKPDLAKLALRAVYEAGRSDPALVEVLNRAAGISSEPIKLAPEDIQRLTAEVESRGDPARGEEIFRRADLSCLKCHAVSGAGGDVGPDLSAVGATSPIEYLLTSVLDPDLSIKEVYLTKNIVTTDGRVVQGIVVDRNDQRVVLKDATGERITVPTSEIDEEFAGTSLMPKGLPSFLTHEEFIDLIRFLSELGRPGPYAVRKEPTVQRWRLLNYAPRQYMDSVPDEHQIAVLLENNRHDSAWLPAYAKTAGELPLKELVRGGQRVLYLKGDVNVTQAGPVTIELDSPDGLHLWLDGKPLAADGPMTAELDRGLHTLLVRVDLGEREKDSLRVAVNKPAGSPAEYTVVGGP